MQDETNRPPQGGFFAALSGYLLMLALLIGTTLSGVMLVEPGPLLNTDWRLGGTEIVVWLPALLALALFALWRRLESPPTVPSSSAITALRRALVVYFGWITLGWLGLILLAWLLQLENPGGELMSELAFGNPWILLFVLIGAPIGEELLFRRMGYRLFLQRGFPLTGAVIVSLGFTMLHVQYLSPRLVETVVYMGSVFVLSLLMCWLYASTRRLLAPVLAHFLINATTLLLGLVAMQSA